MKRPSARHHGKQKHQCACCGATTHRLETCKLPGAAVLLKLRRKVREIQRQSPAKKVFRVQNKNRNSPRTGNDYAKKAKIRYSGSPVSSAAKRPNQRRLVKNSLNMAWKNDDEAYNWLLHHSFVRTLSQCPKCGATNVLGPFFDGPRAGHFRCSPCGDRFSWLGNTQFEGIRTSPMELAKSLCVYARLDVTTAPSTADMVQFADIGRTQDHGKSWKWKENTYLFNTAMFNSFCLHLMFSFCRQTTWSPSCARKSQMLVADFVKKPTWRAMWRWTGPV